MSPPLSDPKLGQIGEEEEWEMLHPGDTFHSFRKQLHIATQSPGDSKAAWPLAPSLCCHGGWRSFLRWRSATPQDDNIPLANGNVSLTSCKKKKLAGCLNLKLTLQICNFQHSSLCMFPVNCICRPLINQLLSICEEHISLPSWGGLGCAIDESISTHSAGISPAGWHEKYFFPPANVCRESWFDSSSAECSQDSRNQNHSNPTNTSQPHGHDHNRSGETSKRRWAGRSQRRRNGEQNNSLNSERSQQCGSISDKNHLCGQNTGISDFTLVKKMYI